MLEHEGVVFDEGARCDLQTFLYIPKPTIKRLATKRHKKHKKE
jgi:hypothetical protein